MPTDVVDTPTPMAHGEWHLCGVFPAAERIAAWAHALHSTGHEGWAKTSNSVSTGRISIIQKCTSHQGNCKARVFQKCIFGFIFTFSELTCILFFTTQMKRSMDLKTGEVQLFHTGVAHNPEAARLPRGIHQPYKEQVNRLLETGHTAADIPAKIALESAKTPGDPGAAPVPHCLKTPTGDPVRRLSAGRLSGPSASKPGRCGGRRRAFFTVASRQETA
jgi:hypothetical protein